MRYIEKENLSDYAFLNLDTLTLPLKGICVCFHGYTDATTYDKSPRIAELLGKMGIAYVFPYYSVWAWMSKNSMEFNEQVLDAVYDMLGADEDIPLIITGGSMGGLTALNYLVSGKRPAAACALNCPVTDMHGFFEDVPTARRAILSAHIEKQGELADVLKEYSPVHFAHRLPNIPYYLVYGEKDPYFTENHMPPMLAKMDACGLCYTALVQSGMGHCDLESHPEALEKYIQFIISAAR